MRIVNLIKNMEVIVKVDTEIGYKLALNPKIKGMFVYEDGDTYVALFNDGDTNWIEDAKTFGLACQWLTGQIDGIELNEKNEEVKNNKEIKILDIFETDFEDGSYWVEYSVGNKHSIEIIDWDEDEEEELDEDKVREKFYQIKKEKLTNKILLDECSELMQEKMRYCLSSENGTWFVEEDEMTKEELEQFEDEIYKLNLDDYIEVNLEDKETPVTIYGAAITRFIY